MVIMCRNIVFHEVVNGVSSTATQNVIYGGVDGEPMMAGAVTDEMKGDNNYPYVWPEEPCVVTCEHCKVSGPTSVDRQLTEMGWCVCIIVGITAWCFTCVVCCIDSLNVYTHNCTNCSR